MSRRAQENIVAAVLLLGFFGGDRRLSLGYGPRARLVPLPVAMFGIVLWSPCSSSGRTCARPTSCTSTSWNS